MVDSTDRVAGLLARGAHEGASAATASGRNTASAVATDCFDECTGKTATS